MPWWVNCGVGAQGRAQCSNMQAEWGVGRGWSASHLCDGCEGGGLLSATLGGRGEEQTYRLPPEGALLPVATGGIKGSLQLSSDHAEARATLRSVWGDRVVGDCKLATSALRDAPQRLCHRNLEV